ncbi:MAG TPA: hypothetical protein VKC55_01040 [Actinomycetota bacterium]|nr:hypothetical protein [Actinomycetota bacterium]
MDGILLQTTRGIRALIGVATEGATCEEVGIGYMALRDQWAAAEREALRGTSDPLARFDARAAAVLGAAYRPVLEVLCSGRMLRSYDVEIAQRSSGWLNLAYEALQAGDHANVDRCLKMATAVVGGERDARDVLPPA